MILPLLSFLIHSWTFKPTMVGSDLFSGCCHMFLTLSDVLGWWVLLVFWIWWVWWVLWVRVGGCGILSFPNPLDLGSGLVLRTPWERPIWLSYMIWTTNTASHFYLIVWYQKIEMENICTFLSLCPAALLCLYIWKTDSGSRSFPFLLNSKAGYSQDQIIWHHLIVRALV